LVGRGKKQIKGQHLVGGRQDVGRKSTDAEKKFPDFGEGKKPVDRPESSTPKMKNEEVPTEKVQSERKSVLGGSDKEGHTEVVEVLPARIGPASGVKY